MNPRIFISSVSSELRSARQDTANVLTRLGYEPIWQDVFGTEAGELKAVLRQKIDDCEGLIHLVGRGYGAESPEPDADFGRVSYTQYEFLYAQSRNKRTWIVFAEDGCSRDTPLEKLDLPREASHPDPTSYQLERRKLQDEWRARLMGGGYLHHAAKTDDQLRLKVNELNREFNRLRRGFRQWQRLVMASIGAIVALLGIVIASQFWLKHDAEQARKSADQALEEIKANQAVSAARIRAHLEEASNNFLAKELTAADQEPEYDKRERKKDAVREAHAMRVKRIGDLAERFAELETRADVSDDFKEMVRILNSEAQNAVDKAVAHAEKGRESRLDRVRKRMQLDQERNRIELQPDLKAAELAAARGDYDKAQALFEETLQLVPDWPEAILAAGQFFYHRAATTARHGLLRDAIAASASCLKLAEHLVTVDPDNDQAIGLLADACDRCGELLEMRGGLEDKETALGHYRRSLVLREKLRSRSPNSTQAIRNVVTSHNLLGKLLAQRGLKGEFEPSWLTMFGRWVPSPVASKEALEHLERSLELSEELLTRLPKSKELQRDIAVGLNNAGDFLKQRKEPGDVELLDKYFARGMELSQVLTAAPPKTAQDFDDLSVALLNLGQFLMKRGAPEDLAQALQNYGRSLELKEMQLRQEKDSARVTRDITLRLSSLSSLLRTRGRDGDHDLAMKYDLQNRELREELFKRFPDSLETKTDLALVTQRIARNSQQAEQAGQDHVRACVLLDEVWAQNGESADAARIAAEAHQSAGHFFDRFERYDESSDHYYKAVDILKQMIAKNLDKSYAEANRWRAENWWIHSFQRSIAVGDWNELMDDRHLTWRHRLLVLRTQIFFRRGKLTDVSQAANALRQLAEEKMRPSDTQAKLFYDAAVAFSQCVTLASIATTSPQDSELMDKSGYVLLALDCLNQAITSGYDDFEAICNNNEFTPLHQQVEFEKLLSMPRSPAE